MQSGSRRAGFYGRRRRMGPFPYRRRSSPTCSTGSIGGTRVTRSALSARAEFFFEFVPFSASQRMLFYDSLQSMVATAQDAVPDDIGALRAALAAALARAEDEAARAALVEAEMAVARAKASDDAALIAHQDLTIRKLQRALHGQSSERSARLHDQMELTFRSSRARRPKTRSPPNRPRPGPPRWRLMCANDRRASFP
ncbi:MAG: hypothetical protein EOQ60_28975, partial [Mesorhizobium sp.]